MVMYTGLWNPSNYRYFNGNDDQDDENVNRNEGERLHLRPTSSSSSSSSPNHRYSSNGNGNGNSISNSISNHNNQINHNSPPRTIEYGSIFEQATVEDKTVTWDDEILSNCGDMAPTYGGKSQRKDTDNDNDDDDDDSGDENYRGSHSFRFHRSSSMSQNNPYDVASAGGSTGTSATSEQALPSLTAAFQSLENRSIIINCLWYLAIYMSLAVVAYSFVFERWTIIDSLYFAVSTFTTCGYGDLEPTTTAGQIFTIGFAIYGVIILGVFIGIFGSFMSEAQTRAMKRFQRKKQSQMMETLFQPTSSSSIRMSERKTNEGKSSATSTPTTNNTSFDSSTSIEKTGFWKDHISLADDIWHVVVAQFPLIALVAIMGLILGIREGWGITSTLYFCIMAATTTGYGDYAPHNQLDKLYCVILLPLAVTVFGEVLGRIASVYIQRKHRLAQSKFVHRSLTLCDLRNMDSNDDGKVDREEFISFMLVALQKVEQSTIDELKAVFDSLDTTGNGFLEEDDLVELAEENYLPTLHRIRKEYSNSTRGEVDEVLLRDLPKDPAPVPVCENSCEQKHRRFHTVL